MPVRPTYRIDQRALMRDLEFAEPTLKTEAERIMREQYFDPAVAQMINDFDTHNVTQEIKAGPDGSNISNTLDGKFSGSPDDTPPNLYTFIGFNPSNGDPTEPIRKRLDPTQASGPKLDYKGKDKGKLWFRFEVRAPKEDVIYNETPVPYAKGTISWAQRIEKGMSGIGHYLNVKRPNSESGGAVQVEGKLPGRIRFKPVQYLSRIFTNFLRRATGGR